MLLPSTSQLRPDVTTLAHLDHESAERGYRAGREFFFVDAEPHERRFIESRLIEQLRENVREMAYWKDIDNTWFFSVGCLLGELSGHFFPIDEQEQEEYMPQRQQIETARKRHKAAQEQHTISVCRAILQEA